MWEFLARGVNLPLLRYPASRRSLMCNQIIKKYRNQYANLRLHPFFFDVMTTGLAQAAIVVVNVLVVGFVSKKMGAVVLGEYLLVKRVSAWVLQGSQLGLGVALPRQIAHTVKDEKMRAKQYFLAALTMVVVFVTGIGVLAVLNANQVARWCFGSENRRLVSAMVLLLLGTAIHSMVFGYFRGLQRMQTANLVAISGLVVTPLIALAMTHRSHSAPLLIGATGLGMAVLSGLWAIPMIVAVRDIPERFMDDSRELLIYGVSRVPGDMAIGGLLAVGPMLVTHYANVTQNSYLLLGITCMTMGGLAIAPVGIVLLSMISRQLGAGRHQHVSTLVGHLRSAVLQLSVVIVVQGLIFTRPLVLWWLGPSGAAGVPVIRMVMLAIPAYMYFAALRSVVDAASAVAYNARNVLMTLAVLIVLLAAVIRFFPPNRIVMGVAAATTLALCLLAFTTHRTLCTLKLGNSSPKWGPLWVVGVLGATSLGAQLAFHFQITMPALGAVLLLNMGLAYLLLRKSQPEWLGFVLRVALTRT